MTAQDFISKGYKLSASTSQNEIDRAVTEVTNAYILPFAITDESEVVSAAIVHFAFIFLLQRKDFVTRVGGAEKTPQNGQKIEVSNYDYRIADSYIHRLAELSPIVGEVEIDDICGIYKQNLINL